MNVRPSVIIIENQKILTLQYNYGGVDVFALPGGNLEFGEKMETALARELTEELNIETEIGHLNFVAQIFRNEKNTLHFIFEGKILEGNISLNSHETTALSYSWIDLDKISTIELYPNVTQFIYQKFVLNQPTKLYLGEIRQNWH